MTDTITIERNNRGAFRAGMLAAAMAAAAFVALGGAATAQDPVRIGILQPYSGGLEALGEQGFQGARLAIDEQNEAGGLLGQQIEYIRADTRTEPKSAVEQTTKLIQRDKVDAIIGPVTSANRDAIRPTIERFGVPLLYATDYEGGTCSPFIVAYSALPEQWVDPLVPYVVENYGNSFYLVGSDYIWPQKMNAAVRRAAEKAGAEVVGEEYLPFGIKDVTSTLRKIESSGADVVVISVVGADAVTLIKQFTAAGLKEKVRPVFLGFSENYLAGLTADEAEGIVTVSNFTASLDKPEARAFVDKVRERYGDNTIVSNTTDAHYNLMRLYFNAVEKAGTTDPEVVIAAIGDQTIQSGNGEVHLRASDKHVDLNVLISVVKDGALELLKDVGRVSGPDQCAS